MDANDEHPQPSDLLNELTRLHSLLSESADEQNAIPLLQDVVLPAASPAPAAPAMDDLRPLLLSTAEQLLQEVVRDFAPQITAELERRLHQHLEELIREQEQIRLQQESDEEPWQP